MLQENNFYFMIIIMFNLNSKHLITSIFFLGASLALHAQTDNSNSEIVDLGQHLDQVDAVNASQDRAKIAELGQYLAQMDVAGLVDDLVDDVAQEGVGISKSYLEKYFKTVELSFTSAGSLKGNAKPTFEILVVAPLSDQEDIFNTYFTQIGASYTDNRTTLNLGLGYRRLSESKYILMGVNTFYDYEIPYNHGRTSLGLEYRTTVGEMNANWYNATTQWNSGKNGSSERALDGYDFEAGVPLPYMNWAYIFLKHSNWNTEVEGAKDLNVNEVQLRAQIPVMPGLEIEAGRRFNSGATTTNESYLSFNYNLIQAFVVKPKNKVWVSDYAYKLASMEDRRYEKVRRENKIIKQKKKSGTITVIGY